MIQWLRNSDGLCRVDLVFFFSYVAGDVLSGTWSDGVWHSGVMEEWFGKKWWTSRFCLMLLTTVFVFAPLISLKRVGNLPPQTLNSIRRMHTN